VGLSVALMAVGLLASPLVMRAQHGGGGGHVGGSAAGGSGLSGGNHATGVDAKDDLRDFHEIMAVQATSEQKIAFAAIVKSAAVAEAQLQGLVEEMGKENNAAEIAKRDKNLADAVETARTLNKKFLEGFSEPQKSGLKEMIKRLGKADSELGQQARTLDQAFEANSGTKPASAQMTSAANGLGHAISIFQHEQTGLGEEMSIDSSGAGQDVAYKLPLVKNLVTLANQPLTIATSGMVSKGVSEGGQNTFAVELTADLTDLQHSFTDVLRGQLNKADRCGERIDIATAALTPQQPASMVVAQLHYERWSCTTMFGRENMNEILEGNATVEVKLTPSVAEDGMLGLTARLGNVDADGLLGESLRSGSLGDMLRDKISSSVLAVMNQGGDFKVALPNGVRDYANLKRARFEEVGAGRLAAVMDGEIRVSNDKLADLTGELKRQDSVAAQSVSQPELMSR
jgi:hypothetical protein